MENLTLDSSKSSDLDGYMLQKRIEIMIDINNKKIFSELDKVRDAINRLNEEISEFRKNLSQGSAIKTEAVTVFKDTVDNSYGNSEVPKNSTQPKPRYGDYKPEDVAIGKFFYFGNKK